MGSTLLLFPIYVCVYRLSQEKKTRHQVADLVMNAQRFQRCRLNPQSSLPEEYLVSVTVEM